MTTNGETDFEMVERVQGPMPSAAPANDVEPPLSWTLERVIKAHVLFCLGHFRGDVYKAAAALGVGKTTLYRWLHTWGIGVKR